jgi:hypothetical protein
MTRVLAIGTLRHVDARLGNLGAGTAGVVSRDIGNGVSRDIGDGVRLGVAASAG